MVNNTIPSWLKSMWNGQKGEAVTKSILLQRFWVLERSVDVNGTDYIIERGMLRKSINDFDYPRLGLVQVKYLSTRYQIKLKFDYVFNGTKEKPILRKDFFLMAIIESQDKDNNYYLLTSEEILSLIDSESIKAKPKAKIVTEKGELLIKISRTLLKSPYTFTQTDVDNLLNKIEETLEQADEYFKETIYHYLGVSPQKDHIKEMYNNNDKIQEDFYQIKKKSNDFINKFLPILFQLRNLASTDDPQLFRDIGFVNIEENFKEGLYALEESVDEFNKIFLEFIGEVEDQEIN